MDNLRDLGLILVLLVAGLIFGNPIQGECGSSLAFFVNEPQDYDYGQLLSLPPTFGEAEFTFEIWIRPDDSYPVGSTASGEGQRLNWSDADHQPYSAGNWWFAGNFLIDGHNNSSFNAGTFSLQFYGGGRVRWLFGDGEWAGPGGHWSVGVYPADGTPSLLDGSWHHITLVRRFAEAGGSILELWIDGSLVAQEATPRRTDMGIYWDDWTGFPGAGAGWFFGAEKQAAIGVLSQYEDYKGPIADMRFWDRAKTAQEIAADWFKTVTGSEVGLLGLFLFSEGQGVVSCNLLAHVQCMDLINMKPGHWSSDAPPYDGMIFSDGFESGDTGAW